MYLLRHLRDLATQFIQLGADSTNEPMGDSQLCDVGSAGTLGRSIDLHGCAHRHTWRWQITGALQERVDSTCSTTTFVDRPYD